MSATTITLWIIKETEKARLYKRNGRQQFPMDESQIWVPISIIEHTTKRGNEHDVKLPDWFIEKNNL